MTKYMCVAAVALVTTSLAALGCSGEDEPNPAGAGAPGVGGAAAGAGGTNTNPVGGAPAGGAPTGAGGGSAGAAPAGDPVQGLALYGSMNCGSCHGDAGVGQLGPNISGSVTAGIGGWTEAQFAQAVRALVGKDGQKLCDLMTAYPNATDAEVKNLYAYLRSVTSDKPERGFLCP